jgi:hypothetical protein
MSADVVDFADFDLPGESREYFLYLQYLIDKLQQELRSLRLASTAQQMAELLGYVENALEWGTDEPEDEETSFQTYCEEVQATFEKAATNLREEISPTYPT